MTRNYGPTISQGGKISALDRVFPNQAALDKHWSLMEALAKRELTHKELTAPCGIHQGAFDALPLQQRIHDLQFTPRMTPQKVAVNANPFESPQLQEHLNRPTIHSGRVDRQAMYSEASREWEAKEAANKAALTDREAREPTIRATRNLADRCRFSPDCPLEDVRASVRMVSQASTPGACLATAQKMYVELATNEDNRTKAKREALQREMDDLRALMGDDDEIVPEPTPEEPVPEKELTPEQQRWAEAEARLAEQERVAGLPGAKFSWAEIKDLPYEERHAKAAENLEAVNEAS